MTARPDEFYIAYAPPVPLGVARRVRRAVAVVAILTLSVAGAIAFTQRDPGDAVWRTRASFRTGLFVAEPFPMLVMEREDAPGARTALLVNPYKCGALVPADRCGPAATLRLAPVDANADQRAALARFNERLVRVGALELERDGRLMLELLSPDGASVEVIDDEPLRARLARLAEPRPLPPADVAGEVVDSKCFLAAMKPGEGRTHRACAVRCVAGGIPPLLAWREPSGRSAAALLECSDVLPYVGDAVEARAARRLVGDLAVYSVQPGALHRH